MRDINLIVIHCSATRCDRDFPVKALEACHKARGFDGIGYHYYVTRDGQLHLTRSEASRGAHAKGYNTHSLGICYEGGLDGQGNPADTRTPAQKQTLLAMLHSLRADYPEAVILGHRDLPKVKKACPCFDVRSEYSKV